MAAAQFPRIPNGVTTVRSKFHENVTISFKEVGPISVSSLTSTVVVTSNSQAFARRPRGSSLTLAIFTSPRGS